ncbi:MAG: homoserine kinase [Elainellaceae cyanobacterium]
MTQYRSVTVTVPATTANLGPGFDCLGAALTLYNRFTFTRSDAPGRALEGAPKNALGNVLEIEVTGPEAERVATNRSNLAYRAFHQLYQSVDQGPPPIHLAIDLSVPLARGLGSSATAIVGGLLGANALSGSPLSRDEILKLAIAIEGHPDNVVPALVGGCQLTVSTPQGPLVCPIEWHRSLAPVLGVPDFELSTATARGVLPKEYGLANAVFSASRVGLLVRGLETGQQQWLGAALEDELHQPYRKTLIAGYDAVYGAALEAGACGLVISGAGPTLLAIAEQAKASRVAEAIADAWRAHGVSASVLCPKLDGDGAQISHLEL